MLTEHPFLKSLTKQYMGFDTDKIKPGKAFHLHLESRDPVFTQRLVQMAKASEDTHWVHYVKENILITESSPLFFEFTSQRYLEMGRKPRVYLEDILKGNIEIIVMRELI